MYRVTLPLLSPEHAAPEAAAILNRSRAQLGFTPNMYAALANAPGLLATYVDGYNQFRSASGLTPAEQEVVLLVISRWNQCHYCVAAHSTVADLMSKVPVTVTDAIRDNRAIPDAQLAALAAFTLTMLETRGRPTRESAAEFVSAGYGETHILQIVLAIAVKTISNYTNHLFDTPLDPLFVARAWREPARDLAGQHAG